MKYRRITPVDVLHLRGNRLFAEGGGARPVMPPWPSLFSGALRSQILTRHDALSAFLTGTLSGEVGAVVGARRKDGPGNRNQVMLNITRHTELDSASILGLNLQFSPEE